MMPSAFQRHVVNGPRLANLVGRVCLVLSVAAMAALLGGCTDPLLAPNEPRSQYDRYDAIRAQRAPSYLEDEYGRRRPNLRGRLLAKD
ncbi:MAG: hypothetical protein SFY96_08860 [Planctomycetota bacterium]|nr:hypothetical protein [Planctomycetota bacterium]